MALQQQLQHEQQSSNRSSKSASCMAGERKAWRTNTTATAAATTATTAAARYRVSLRLQPTLLRRRQQNIAVGWCFWWDLTNVSVASVGRHEATPFDLSHSLNDYYLLQRYDINIQRFATCMHLYQEVDELVRGKMTNEGSRSIDTATTS